MATTPMAIGTRGTVGSLVRREIEYFKRLDIERDVKKGSSTTTSSNGSKPNSTATSTALGYFLPMSWRRKKRRRSNQNSSFLPSMCSAVDIRQGNNRFEGMPGFSYRNLKEAMEKP